MVPLSRLAVRQEIQKLMRMDASRASYEAIQAKYHKLMHNVVIRAGQAGGGELFFRVRRTDGTKPKFITEIGAPPSEVVTGYQRCNPPGTPMFYAASRRIGALIEARAAIDETIYLSQWIGEIAIPVNKVFTYEATDETPMLPPYIPPGPNDDLVLTHIDTLFTRRIDSAFSDDYKFTAAIAQQLTSKFVRDSDFEIHRDGHVALRYPSVLGIEDWYNTAMHGSFASDRLVPIHIMELKILSLDGLNISVQILDTATKFEDGEIHWTADPTLVPALIGSAPGPGFVFTGNDWQLQLHDATVTPDVLRALFAE